MDATASRILKTMNSPAVAAVLRDHGMLADAADLVVEHGLNGKFLLGVHKGAELWKEFIRDTGLTMQVGPTWRCGRC